MENLIALIGFVFVATITPGPVNVLLAASGVSFGVKRTLPHLLGAPAGFGIVLLLCAFGLGQWLLAEPMLRYALNMIGSLYLIYLMWSLGTAIELVAQSESTTDAQPLTFAQSFFFQFSNPKAWLMSTLAASLFISAPEFSWLSVLILLAVFSVIGFFSNLIWLCFGSAAKGYMVYAFWRRAFIGILLLTTALTLVLIWR